MIFIEELNLRDIGKWVEYTGGAGEKEKGRIKSWNDNFIFVVYKCAGEWFRFKDFTAEATDPEDLEFCGEETK